MALNPNIALGVRPLEVPNQLAQYGQMQQIMAAQDAQQLNALKMQEAQAGLEERNKLRALNPAAADYEAQLFKVNPQLGISYRKEQATTAAQKAAETKSLTEAAAAKQKMMGQAYRDISGRPSDANITAHLEDIAESTLYSDAEKASITKRGLDLLAMPFAERQMFLAQQGASASELKPSTQTINRAGATDIVRVPAFSGAPATVSTYADVPLPADVQAQKIQIAQQSRPPRAEPAPRTQQVTMSDGTLGIMNMDTGVVTPSTMAGAPVKGKPSAFAEKTAAQKVQMGKDLNFAITQLSDITKDGGLIDQSTGSGIGRGVDIGAGLFGQATKGAIAIGKIAPVADLVLKMVPRFEGPQSNKDTQSYKEAAGQLADPTLPTAIRKEAGKTVLRLMKERQGQFVTSDMAAEGVGGGGGGGVDTSNPLLK
jgi:hypothetical protein